MSILRYTKDVLMFGVIILALFFVISGLTHRSVPETVVTETQEATSTPNQFNRLIYFSNLELDARAAYVFDLKTNTEIFARNIDVPLPIASLTKLMTALVALENAPDNNTIVTVTPESLEQDGNSGLALYEQWNLGALLDVVLVSSSNDGAYAIASAITPFIGTSTENTFIDVMNMRAKQLGMNDTSFITTTGLDINNETEPSAYSSARDITNLFGYILRNYPEILEPTRLEAITRTSISNRQHHVLNTNPFVSDIPLLIGSKTGFTDNAGGNLIIAFDAGLGHPVIVAVLGSTPEGRFTDVEELVKAIMQYTAYDA